PQPSTKAGWWRTFFLASSAMSRWHCRQMFTASVLGSPGVLLACGEWQSVQSPPAPGCCTFAAAICVACLSWHITHNVFASACVSTTFPSFAGAWHNSHCLSAKGGCMNLAISFGAADWCGSWHCKQFAVPNGWFWCAFCRSASFGSWQSTQSAGAGLVRWFRFSMLGSSPVLWVRWHVSQPISNAACLLPFSGTFEPVVWQPKQRFSFALPDVGFNN